MARYLSPKNCIVTKIRHTVTQGLQVLVRLKQVLPIKPIYGHLFNLAMNLSRNEKYSDYAE